MNIPSTALVGELIWGVLLDPPSYRPCLGLRRRVATRPVTPPTRCTGPAPAMSTTPILYNQPLEAQTQCAGILNNTVLMNEKSMYDVNFVRSAIAPEIDVHINDKHNLRTLVKKPSIVSDTFHPIVI